MQFVCFSECFVLFPGAFYGNPPSFDGAAAYVPPPPYSATLAQAPLDPDLPRTAAGPEPGQNNNDQFPDKHELHEALDLKHLFPERRIEITKASKCSEYITSTSSRL